MNVGNIVFHSTVLVVKFYQLTTIVLSVWPKTSTTAMRKRIKLNKLKCKATLYNTDDGDKGAPLNAVHISSAEHPGHRVV